METAVIGIGVFVIGFASGICVMMICVAWDEAWRPKKRRRRRVETAVHKILHDPARSKKARVAQGKALTSQ